MPFYVIPRGPDESILHVIVDPKNLNCVYAQVINRDGSYRTCRGYLVDWV
jgi:hypothetical protein